MIPHCSRTARSKIDIRFRPGQRGACQLWADSEFTLPGYMLRWPGEWATSPTTHRKGRGDGQGGSMARKAGDSRARLRRHDQCYEMTKGIFGAAWKIPFLILML